MLNTVEQSLTAIKQTKLNLTVLDMMWNLFDRGVKKSPPHPSTLIGWKALSLLKYGYFFLDYFAKKGFDG